MSAIAIRVWTGAFRMGKHYITRSRQDSNKSETPSPVFHERKVDQLVLGLCMKGIVRKMIDQSSIMQSTSLFPYSNNLFTSSIKWQTNFWSDLIDPSKDWNFGSFSIARCLATRTRNSASVAQSAKLPSGLNLLATVNSWADLIPGPNVLVWITFRGCCVITLWLPRNRVWTPVSTHTHRKLKNGLI